MEALQAHSSHERAETSISLHSAQSEGQVYAYLEFVSRVPAGDSVFTYQKAVETVVSLSPADEVYPLLKDTPIECDVPGLSHLNSVTRAISSEDYAVQVGITVESCPLCVPEDELDEVYVFECSHARRQGHIPRKGTLTLRTVESSLLEVTTSLYNVELSGTPLTSLYTGWTVLKGKYFASALQRASGLGWPKAKFGLVHGKTLVVTLFKEECLTVNFLVPAYVNG